MPAIFPDNLNKGVQSDHSGVVATPYTNSNQPQQRTKIVKTIRPLPESLISVFGGKLQNVDWFELDTVEITFPEKVIKIYPDDQPWFNEKLRSLKRERQRLYLKGPALKTT